MHLDPLDLDGLTAFLADAGLLADGERVVDAAKAGEGNMNLTLRVDMGGRTLIVKQARPWVEKYPSIPAPVERAEVEAAFYTLVGDDEVLAARMPTLRHHDPAHHVLVMDDLGAGTDLSALYDHAVLSPDDLDGLLAWLRRLHLKGTADAPAVMANRGLRALNHAHVFDLPFRDEPVVDLHAIHPDLPGLRDQVLATPGVREAIEELGERYLADGDRFVHGDFYPGSFLRTADGLFVLDPEFGHLGDPAWDHGVLLAHLVLAHQDPVLWDRVDRAGRDGTRAFAAVEILRRLFGVAQLGAGAVHAPAGKVALALDWLVA